MNRTIKLSTGKILDMSRFVALIPNEQAQEQGYSLILSGSSETILISNQEARSIEESIQAIENQEKNETWDREVQKEKNREAIALMRERIANTERMSDSESKKRAEYYEEFKKTMDSHRTEGRKLYENS